MLSLRGWRRLSDDALQFILNECHALSHLDISGLFLLLFSAFLVSRHIPVYIFILFSESPLTGCSSITDNGLLKLQKHSSSLSSLDVSQCCNFTDQAMSRISRCSLLRKISIKGLLMVTDAGVLSILQNCHQLVSVDLSSLPLVSSNAVSQIAVTCPLIENLSLAWSSLLTAQGLIDILFLPKLQVLDISHANPSTDDALSLIAGPHFLAPAAAGSAAAFISATELFPASSSLRKLIISFCSSMSPQALEQFLQVCPSNLQCVEVTACPDVAGLFLFRFSFISCFSFCSFLFGSHPLACQSYLDPLTISLAPLLTRYQLERAHFFFLLLFSL